MLKVGDRLIEWNEYGPAHTAKILTVVKVGSKFATLDQRSRFGKGQKSNLVSLDEEPASDDQIMNALWVTERFRLAKAARDKLAHMVDMCRVDDLTLGDTIAIAQILKIEVNPLPGFPGS